MPKRSSRPSVCAKSRAVIWTSWPCARSAATIGRRTSTCGLFVRSTQTRIAAPRLSARPGADLHRTAHFARRRSIACAHVFVVASLTDPIVEFATNVVADLGLPGVFILMLPESACIPIPSEATMLFAGFNVSEGEYSLIAVTLVGSVANLVGSWVAYGVGYYGRVDLIEKHGHKVFISPTHLVVADRWFERHGEATVSSTRMLPIVRTFISLPAGVARMPFIRFSVLTFLGCVPWVFMLDVHRPAGRRELGRLAGLLHYFDYFVAVLHRRGRRLPVREVAPRRRRRATTIDRPGGAGGRCPQPLTNRAPAHARRPRARPAARSGRAAADLLLGSRRARAVAVRLALQPARRRAAQGLRGRAARRHRGGAARRAARRGRRGGARRWTAGACSSSP